MTPATAVSPSYATVDEILARVDPPLTAEGARQVRKAYEIAEKAHEGQLRRSGEPYFSHCVGVTMLLADLVADWPTLAAGLLHDTIEDCGFTPKHIHSLLPDPVADLVDGVSKISKLNFSSDRERQAGNLRKMIMAMARDVRVLLIKLCDRLHNMRTLNYLEPAKQKLIATGTLEIYAPLAKRLGVQKIGSELEDLCLSYIHPALYRGLAEHIERNKERYQTIINKTKTILESSLAKAHVHATVAGRLKHIYSTYQKMLRQGLNLNEIHDLIAMRIITDTVAETYEALGIVHSRWKPVEGKFNDYIAAPKPNGYQSLHTTVIGVDGEIIEIQIRTQAMHKLADQGVAAHWKYKEEGSNETAEAAESEKLLWLRQLVDWLQDVRDPQEFMAAVKQDVFEASVFCYTPRGDVIEMPNDSSVLDFAYRIHTEIGHQCAGAKVNHKMVPLRTILKTGDIVEIVTSKSSHPTPDWLHIATSGRAKNKIRHWLKTHDREFYLERGRSMFTEHLRVRSPSFRIRDAMEKLELEAKHFSLSDAEDVLIEIGFGTIKPAVAVARILPPDTAPPPPKRVAPGKKKAAPESILVEGMPGAITRMAGCCAPKPGDPILGFITLGRGISIHRADCKSLERSRQLQDDSGRRVVGVQWNDGTPPLLQATIRVVCQDRKGLLTDVTQAVTQLGVFILAAHTLSNLKTNQAILKLTVQVQDEGTLNTLLKRLESVPSVRSLRRIIHRQ